MMEFELKIRKTTKTMVMYDVNRKGLNVGFLMLDKPYNEREAKTVVIE